MKKNIMIVVICLSVNLLRGQENYWNRHSPYQVTLKNDLITGGVALAVYFAGTITEHHEDLDPFLPGSFTNQDILKINRLDRGVAGYFDLNAMKASDILKSKSKLAAQAAVLLLPGNLKTRGSLLLIYLEGLYLTNGLTSLVKGVTDRYRPYTYLSEDRISKLDDWSYSRYMKLMGGTDIEDSFFSGHASSAAYSLVFLATAFGDYFPETKWKYGIWGLCIAGTAAEAWFRVKSGAHFPTDVLVGSLIGGAAGYFVPFIHKKAYGKSCSLQVGPGRAILTFLY